MEIRELEILIRPTKNHQKTRFWAMGALVNDNPLHPRDISPLDHYRGLITVYGVVDGSLQHSVNRYWNSWQHRHRARRKKIDLGYEHATDAESAQLRALIESHLTWAVLMGVL